ncbi:MAG: ribonuclease HI family protein [Patescibacteria group bacterium]|nr:ribonuclease HI family protein [Patescibacteria group bacterium]
MKTIKLYTDGGARGNPGPAATGVVITNEVGEILKTATKFLGTATNNQAEYEALLQGLREAQEFRATKVQAFLDSELIVKQLKGEYRVKDTTLKVLHGRAQKLISVFTQIEFHHIRRLRNSAADALVNQTLDKHT